MLALGILVIFTSFIFLLLFLCLNFSLFCAIASSCWKVAGESQGSSVDDTGQGDVCF